MLVNGIKKEGAIEYKGSWQEYYEPFFNVSEEDRLRNEFERQQNELEKEWWFDIMEIVGYDLSNYHVYEYKEWEDDFHYTILETAGKTKVWVLNKKINRENDKPAVITGGGCKMWFKDNKCHRDLGPALIGVDGTKQWLQNDKLHNEYGPAWVEKDITKFYIKGKQIKEESLINYPGLEKYAKFNMLK